MTYLSSLLSKILRYLYPLKPHANVSRRVTQTYPDLDSVFLNAGVQGAYDFSTPEMVDLKAFFSEFNVNFTSMVTLTHAFLPFLQNKKTPTSLIL